VLLPLVWLSQYPSGELPYFWKNRIGLKLLRYCYIFWALLVFTAFMVLLLPFFLVPALFGQRGMKVTYFFLKMWSWIFSKLTFIPYEISGRENIDPHRSCIYVSNHTSFLDIPGICLTLPGEFRPLAKKELLKLPVFGWIASAVTVIVDRSSHESRRKSMERLQDLLRRGVPVLIFPEGTQNRSDQLLQPFKDGAFRMAIETGCPIVPIVIEGAGRLMPPGKFFITHGKVRIRVGKPVPVESGETVTSESLRIKVFGIMEEMLSRLRKESTS